MDPPTQRAQRRDALVVDALSAVFDMLQGVPASARTRELAAQARSYEQVVKQWTAVPPTEAQLGAMFDVVTALHAKAVLTIGPASRATRSGGR